MVLLTSIEEEAGGFGAGAYAFKACQVSDTGGIDDKSFNATAWKGAQDAMDEFGIEAKRTWKASSRPTTKRISRPSSMRVAISSSTSDSCWATPPPPLPLPTLTRCSAIVDYAYDPALPNVLGQVFTTDEAAFLAGYLAAGMTQTGTVATFGGIQIPTVTVFMDGFALGVDYYNQQKGTAVQVLGWDPATQTDSFTGNFESKEDGRTLGLSFIDEGADIIMPVAGPVGLGTAPALKERGNAYLIGVDSDWYLSDFS